MRKNVPATADQLGATASWDDLQENDLQEDDLQFHLQEKFRPGM